MDGRLDPRLHALACQMIAAEDDVDRLAPERAQRAERCVDDAGNSIQRTISTFSATFISAATAVCRSTPGSTRTTGSTIIRPNIAVILSGQSARVVLC
jgi:hypothetical protein